ncbi:ATP-binding protein [Pedobacter heparinus]|uniref:ATP-binding protein n=1 Tax=Pedobacter heparinus TaxID=984 RepID=UPI002930B0C3|nr:ATP-binding protein [Pedobacter heparinus]
MFHLYNYKTHPKYAAEFKETYSYQNSRQIKILSGLYLFIALSVRLISFLNYDVIAALPNFMEYNINNWVSIIGSTIFLFLSNNAMKPGRWTISRRKLLTTSFCLFALLVSFAVSYIYSLHNPKNTLTVFLIGILFVSIFFAIDFKQTVTVSLFILLLFSVGMIFPALNMHEKLFNIIAAGILIFFFFACSRYSYYFKSEQFTKVRQLEEKNAEVQLLNHQKSEILGFVAHDLRNPLNNIEALTRILLEEDTNQNSPEMQLILTSTRQAKNIINDLIEVAQNDRRPFQLQTTNMITFMNGICENWQKNLNKERLINFQTEQELALNVAVNPSKLTRVIDNLIANGLKFSRPETPINIGISKSSDLCIIKITDFGIGIPQHLLALLFDQFSKAGRPGLKGEKSIGLGLHISKQIIEQHGGTLTVESTENEGTTFQIAIPLAA